MLSKLKISLTAGLVVCMISLSVALLMFITAATKDNFLYNIPAIIMLGVFVLTTYIHAQKTSLKYGLIGSAISVLLYVLYYGLQWSIIDASVNSSQILRFSLEGIFFFSFLFTIVFPLLNMAEEHSLKKARERR